MIPITRPQFTEAETEAATRVIRSGWVMQGPEVQRFEQEFAAAVGARHAIAVANGTLALELALRLVGVKPGDQVITASHSFIATANAVRAVGAIPVFVDVEAETFGLSPSEVERAITPRTRAIMPVHQIGIPCSILPIIEIANRRGVPVIEDAACALGSALRTGGEWQRVGRPHGNLACFSFHPRKIVTTGDGGMITTDSEAEAKRLRAMRNHFLPVSNTVQTKPVVSFEDFAEVGFNYRMTDLGASIGRTQLARLDAILTERLALGERYHRALEGFTRVRAHVLPRDVRTNWQSYPVSVRPGAQRELMQFLLDRQIACRRGVGNAHQEPAYADRTTWGCAAFPGACERGCQNRCDALRESERLRDETVLIPLFHGMSTSEQDDVIAALTAYEHS